MLKPLMVSMVLLVSPVVAQAETQLARLAPLPVIKADKIVVLKGARQLMLLRNGGVFQVYPIDLGFRPTGHKVREGDGRTPEGLYEIDWRNPGSRFHLSLRVSYPNAADQARAAALGVAPGGMIMIHGQPNEMNGRALQRDWTEGCIAVSNTHMEQIWRAVDDGTPIEIRP